MNKNKLVIVTISLVALLAFIGYSIYIISRPIPLEIQGQVEAWEVKAGSKIPGRIDRLYVKKGDEIAVNTLLYTISSPEIDAKLLQAIAARDAVQAQKEKAANGAQVEDIQAAFNTWQKAKAAADYAKKTFARIENLNKDGVVPDQKKDETEAQMIAAVETEKAANSVYQKAKNGARDEDKKAANALVRQVDGMIREVTAYQNENKVFAPLKGEVSNILAEPGEIVPAGFPVVSIVDLDDVWVTFNLREDLLTDIHKGSEIEAHFPALGMKSILLKVNYIHALGEFATWNATKTSGDFDMKTFEVHAIPIKKTEGLRPGMTALVNWDLVRKNNQ